MRRCRPTGFQSVTPLDVITGASLPLVTATSTAGVSLTVPSVTLAIRS